MVFADSLTKAGRLMELQLIFATRPYRAHSTRGAGAPRGR
jgi:hypothetical protein